MPSLHAACAIHFAELKLFNGLSTAWPACTWRGLQPRPLSPQMFWIWVNFNYLKKAKKDSCYLIDGTVSNIWLPLLSKRNDFIFLTAPLVMEIMLNHSSCVLLPLQRNPLTTFDVLPEHIILCACQVRTCSR